MSNLPQPDKPGMVNENDQDIDVRSDILSLPSSATDDVIAFSDIPICSTIEQLTMLANKIDNQPGLFADASLFNKVTIPIDKDEKKFDQCTLDSVATRFRKPKGSAYIFIEIRIDNTDWPIQAYVCVDTGADITLCDSAYLLSHFGKDAMKHVIPMTKPPKLRSATGHSLKILGKVSLTLFLGEYELDVRVIVYEGQSSIFLLGNDSFYGRLIYDRGIFLSIADGNYPPIPILYELDRDKVKAIRQYQVAPRSHALIQVKVTDSPQLTGKEIMLSPLDSDDLSWNQHVGDVPNLLFDNQVPVRNTVSVIDSQGCSSMLVQNNTDDILTVCPDIEIARVNFISGDLSHINQISFILDDGSDDKAREKRWPISALTGEFKDTIPSNVLVQWERISKQPLLTDPKESHVNFVHDKEERKNLLDGTGDGFPTPPAAQSVHPDQDSDPDPDAWLSNVEHKHLTDPEWEKLKAVLLKNKEAFAKTKTEIGCCKYFRVNLPLKPGTGYLYNKPRPLPHKHREIAAETISELLAKGVIRPSNSPHATNIVVVKKKTMNGVTSHRVCVDLRQVNENSVPNRFPNYLIDDAMSKLQGSYYRSALDFRDAFHMMVLTEESIPVTAFHFNNVLFEYVRVPFGHVCAMNAFCCLMALLCVDYDPASYYADDLMITTKTNHNLSKDQLFTQHLEHIDGMLARIVDAGLKLVAHKCQWCYTADKPMEWLGFTMEHNLLKPQEAKVAAIKDFPVPTTAKQVISFVSTASFYRRFIKSFAKEVQPMYDVANKDPFVWTPEAQTSFEKLKEIMCSDLVLRLPRQGEPFQIYSDASAGAIGVVLCQIDPIDKKSHPCAFGSRKFNECELKLSIPCKELLAIVYGLNLWSFYICGNPVQVFSDCRAWTFLKVQSGTSGKISRLALLVSEYDISISYVKGTQNKAADGLSRAFDDGQTKFDDQITARHPALNELGAPVLLPGEVLKLNEYLEKCDGYISTHWPKILKDFESRNPDLDQIPNSSKMQANLPGKRLVKPKIDKSLVQEAEYVDKTIQEAVILHIDRVKVNDWTRHFGKENIYPFQVVDDYISVDSDSTTDEPQVKVESDSDSDTETSESETEFSDTTDNSLRTASYNIRLIAMNEPCFTLPAFADLQKQDEYCSGKIDLLKKKDIRTQQSGYFIKRNILMRKMQTRDGQQYEVICVPRVLVKPLLESTHNTLASGHFGSRRYYLSMTRKYFWPKMKEYITEFHRKCIPCQYNDKFPVKFVSGHVIRPRWPMHIVHCDLVVGLPRALDGSHAILLLYDGFSRFTFGIPLTSEKADYVVNKLMSHFVAAFGLPWALHSDNGRNVDGALIRHLSLMLGVLKTSTPPHTPNANPTETMCGAVSMLLRKALNASDQRYWSLCLPFVLNALNTTVHTATGYTPNSLFFGRYRERDLVPLIPFDAESANVNEYFQKMRRFQELAFQIVRSRNERKIQAKKADWDTHARTHNYKVGDFVLIKNKNPASGPGKKKLRAIYIGPFRVLKDYVSSLIVVPWTENSRLEEYYKDPNVFRLMHRGDIKPFHTRQVSVKHCKPFRGNIDTIDIIDPIMMSRFLDALGVNNQDEIVSQIDTPPSEHDTFDFTDVSSDPSEPDGNPPPPPPFRDDNGDDDDNGDGPNHVVDGYYSSSAGDGPTDPESDSSDSDHSQDPVPEHNPESSSDESSDDLSLDPKDAEKEEVLSSSSQDQPFNDPTAQALFDNVDASQSTKDILKELLLMDDSLEKLDKLHDEFKVLDKSNRERLIDLEQLIRSPDPDVRLKAERDLEESLKKLKIFKKYRYSLENVDLSKSFLGEMVEDGTFEFVLSDPPIDLNQDLADLDSIHSDHAEPPDDLHDQNLSDEHPEDDDIPQNAQPATPGPIEDPDTPFLRRSRRLIDKTEARIRDWMSTPKPKQGHRGGATAYAQSDEEESDEETAPKTPYFTKSGREVKTPARYSRPDEYYEEHDELLEKTLREYEKRSSAKKSSKLAKKAKSSTKTKTDEPEPGPSRQLPKSTKTSRTRRERSQSGKSKKVNNTRFRKH